MPGILFLPDKDVFDPGVVYPLIERSYSYARIPEDFGLSLRLKAFHRCFCTDHICVFPLILNNSAISCMPRKPPPDEGLILHPAAAFQK